MNPYEHVRPVHRAKAADVNKHYAVGRWLLAVADGKADEIRTYGKMAEEFGVNIKDLRRLIR